MREPPALTDDEQAVLDAGLRACLQEAKYVQTHLRGLARAYRNRGPLGLLTMFSSLNAGARMLVDDLAGAADVEMREEWPAPTYDVRLEDAPDAWPLWLLPGATVRAEAPGGRVIAVGVLREVTPRGLVLDAPPVGPDDHAGEFLVYHHAVEAIRLLKARPEGPLEVGARDG